MVEPRHERRAQHAVALARSAKPGPRAKPGAHFIRMRPTSHPRRDTSRPTCPKRSPPQLQQPIFTSSHQSGLRFEQQPNGSPPTQRPNMGGFATIGPRHAGDTPAEASYGSNSPRTCGLGRTSNTTTSAETPSTLDTSAPTYPKRSPPPPLHATHAHCSSHYAPQPTHAVIPRTPLAQSAVHLSYNSPFSPVPTEVDDVLSSNPTAHRQLRGQTWGVLRP